MSLNGDQVSLYAFNMCLNSRCFKRKFPKYKRKKNKFPYIDTCVQHIKQAFQSTRFVNCTLFTIYCITDIINKASKIRYHIIMTIICGLGQMCCFRQPATFIINLDYRDHTTLTRMLSLIKFYWIKRYFSQVFTSAKYISKIEWNVYMFIKLGTGLSHHRNGNYYNSLF